MGKNHTPDPRELISSGRMTPRQAATVITAILLSTLDGYDLLVTSFVSTHISREFGLSAPALGTLLSASLFGMAVGAFFIAPFADRLGRRPITLAAVTVMTLVMGLSAMAGSAMTLGVLRFVCGLAIGCLLPNLSTLISEYSTDRWRDPALLMGSVGYALGGTVGGFIASWTIPHLGWRSAFWLGAVMGLIGLLASLPLIPESIHFLMTRRPAGTLENVNRVLARFDRAPITDLPKVEVSEKASVSQMFRGSLGRTTILVWICFFGLMASFYFANSWTPKLLNQSGLSEQQSVIGGVLISFGGLIGALVLAALSVRIPAKVLGVATLLGSAAMFVLFSMALKSATTALITAVAVGLFVNASVAALYAVVTTRYPVAVRATGLGWGVGMGRLGAILAPMSAGWLLGAGMTPPDLFIVFAVPAALAGLALALVGKAPRSRPAEADPATDPART